MFASFLFPPLLYVTSRIRYLSVLLFVLFVRRLRYAFLAYAVSLLRLCGCRPLALTPSLCVQYMVLPNATVTVSVASSPNPDGTVNVTVSTDATAVYVTLTTLAAGRFSDNAFLAMPGDRVLTFIPFGDLTLDVLTSSIRVEHVAMYQGA